MEDSSHLFSDIDVPTRSFHQLSSEQPKQLEKDRKSTDQSASSSMIRAVVIFSSMILVFPILASNKFQNVSLQRQNLKVGGHLFMIFKCARQLPTKPGLIISTESGAWVKQIYEHLYMSKPWKALTREVQVPGPL